MIVIAYKYGINIKLGHIWDTFQNPSCDLEAFSKESNWPQRNEALNLKLANSFNQGKIEWQEKLSWILHFTEKSVARKGKCGRLLNQKFMLRFSESMEWTLEKLYLQGKVTHPENRFSFLRCESAIFLPDISCLTNIFLYH